MHPCSRALLMYSQPWRNEPNPDLQGRGWKFQVTGGDFKRVYIGSSKAAPFPGCETWGRCRHRAVLWRRAKRDASTQRGVQSFTNSKSFG
jgi:hypothetical protein